MSNEPRSQFLFYQTSDGQTRLEVRLESETVWFSFNQLDLRAARPGPRQPA